MSDFLFINALICADSRLISCCSIMFDSVCSIYLSALFLHCLQPQGQAQWQAAEPFCSKAWEATGVAVDSISGRAKLSVSKHAAVQGDVMPCAPSKDMRSTENVLLRSV